MADVYCAAGPPARAPGGAEAALPALRRGRGVRRALPPRGVERRPASSTRNVVAVYDRGEWDGTYYIAMEYLEGRSLKQIVERGGAAGARPRDRPRSIQILRAARFAHRRGIIHRDLKPHNVIVDDEGRAKVTDFGIARAGASDMTADRLDHGHRAVPLARAGPGPRRSSARSDLYSIGIMLYEMLTGRVPFDGESAVTIALKQVSEAPRAAGRLQPGRPARARGRRAARAGEGPGARASPTPTSSSPRSRPCATATADGRRSRAVPAPPLDPADAEAYADPRGARSSRRPARRGAGAGGCGCWRLLVGRRAALAAVLLLPGTQKVAVPDRGRRRPGATPRPRCARTGFEVDTDAEDRRPAQGPGHRAGPDGRDQGRRRARR